MGKLYDTHRNSISLMQLRTFALRFISDDAIAIKCSICDESFDNQPSKYLVHKLIHHTSIQQQKHLVRLLNNADLKSEETFCMNETFYNVLISLKRIPNPIKPELVNIDEEEHFYPPEPEIMTIPFVEKIEPIFDETIEAKEPNLKEESSKKEELCSLPSNQCPICLKMFANKYTLSTHFKTIHSEEANVKTTTKLKNRSERDALKKTKDDTQIPVTEDHSGEVATEVSVHKCEFCPLTFTRLKYYESHTRRHIERNAIYRKKRQTKKHLCNVCGKRFQEAYDLKMHLYVHSDERPLSCDICGKGFVIKATLRMHMLIHTGEKVNFINYLYLFNFITLFLQPHVCNVDGCGRTFKHASGKRQHYNSAHSNVKPFSCEQCKKTFTRKSHLTYVFEVFHFSALS